MLYIIIYISMNIIKINKRYLYAGQSSENLSPWFSVPETVRYAEML